MADVDLGPEGSSFTIRGPGGLALPASVALPGDFNVANALSAVAAAVEAGLDPGAVVAGHRCGRGRPGAVGAGPRRRARGFAVYVDYAHKPDALTAVLGTLRPVTAGRLIVVIGAGGDRDRGKRPVMGAIAAADADLLIVTDDNPRTEAPEAIRAEVLAGVDDVEVLEGPRCARSVTDGRPSPPLSRPPDRATSYSLPARGTRPARRSRVWCTRSTTARSSASCSGGAAS